MEKNNIDKNKLVFVNEANYLIKDEPLPTKQISYFQDALNRFRKNKGSIFGFIIICVIIFFTLFGPFLKNNVKVNGDELQRFQYLTPKIPVLEKFGIFDGTKKLEVDQAFLESLPEGIVLKFYEKNTGSDGKKAIAKVDYYKYANYTKSYRSEDNKLMYRQLTMEQYEIALSRNAVIDVNRIVETIGEDGIRDVSVYARVDAFKYLLNQTTDDTYFWFGTNFNGNDLFIDLWSAARISILLATIVSVTNLIIGAFIGAIIGYYGGVVDILFDRIVEILSGLPFMAVLTIIVLAYGSSVAVIFFAFVATGWIGSYGRTRMQFYRYKGREYVLAARTLGAKDRRIMFKHIMPNAIGTLITSFALAIPSFMFGEATYSYLGIIKYKNTTSIGELLSTGQASMKLHPHLLIFPAIYISILMLSFNLFGNGLRDAFNPSLRGVE